MNRIKFALAAVCLAFSGCQVRTEKTETAEPVRPPNIILIVADDMGYTDLGSFGSEIRTPNLDELAYGGIRLTNFHSSPQCAPTRSMLMSGADNHTAGMGSMFDSRIIQGGFGDRTGYEGYLHPRVATLPERLGDAGYHTYMAGKWHLGADDEKKPTARGFDKAFAFMEGSASHLEMRAMNNGRYREDGEYIDEVPEDFYTTNYYTDKMIEYIGSNQGDDTPFFGYLALTSPHWPLQAPPDFIDRYVGEYDDGYDALRERRVARATEMGVVPVVDPILFERIGEPWDELSDEEKRYATRRMEIYAAMVDNMDYNVGRLVSYLKETGQFENTVFFFMSDNGAESDNMNESPTFSGAIRRSNYYHNSFENLGSVTSWESYGPGWAQAGMAPFRLFKGFSTEGGNRVTAFAVSPDLANPGRINDQYLTVMDVMPTFLDIAAAEFDETTVRDRLVVPMKGRSFRSVMEGKPEPVHGPDEVIATELHGQRALVRGEWKLVWEQEPANIWWDDKPQDHWRSWRLYNLAEDATEQNDLSDTEPELREELIALWHQYAEENDVMESVTPQWPSEPAPGN